MGATERLHGTSEESAINFINHSGDDMNTITASIGLQCHGDSLAMKSGDRIPTLRHPLVLLLLTISGIGTATAQVDSTSYGSGALSSNSGSYNSAFGASALNDNQTGERNTADGWGALQMNVVGTKNTATGAVALYNNTGNYNTADGYGALYLNQGGSSNTAIGITALLSDTNGSSNTAAGAYALYSSNGNYNTATGAYALYYNIDGSSNTAIGDSALYNVTGSSNVGVGSLAGADLTSGSNNIDIGSQGAPTDSGITRIGTSGLQEETFISGIVNSKITGSAVYVTAGGQLGVLASSERYKTSIAPIGSTSEKLEQLRPVSFHLKNDPQGEVQYGLIAEEVAKVYPELVIRGESGTIEGVRYDELAPLLLNEFQEQQKRIAAQDATIKAQFAQNDQQGAELREIRAQLTELNRLKESMLEALSQLPAKSQRVAMR
jgi:hypothetical protein